MVDQKTKKGLGRGLMSLFGDQTEDPSIKPITNNPYLLVSISDLAPNKYQPEIFLIKKK